MRSLAGASALLAALLVAAGCGGKSAQDGSQGNALAQGWNPVSGMLCADGSATGIGVSMGSRNSVLVVLAGGGACWSDANCGGNVPRTFGAGDYGFFSLLTSGTIFDRTLAGNPFADWTFVFVPYCTGDVHAGGDVTRTYNGVTWRHHGAANLQAAIGRVAQAFPAPERVVVAGSSAGGFGSFLAFDLARQRWPAGASGPKAYLVDDSGPTLVGNDLPATIRDAWWASWNLAATVTPLCAACGGDLSQLWTVLHAKYPGDRLALLSTTQDTTMRAYFGGMSGAAFESALATLATTLQGIPNAASFRVGDMTHMTGHAMLLSPASYSAGGTALPAWLAQQVTDAAGWTSAGP